MSKQWVKSSTQGALERLNPHLLMLKTTTFKGLHITVPWDTGNKSFLLHNDKMTIIYSEQKYTLCFTLHKWLLDHFISYIDCKYNLTDDGKGTRDAATYCGPCWYVSDGYYHPYLFVLCYWAAFILCSLLCALPSLLHPNVSFTLYSVR